ncbi:unnamed protein product [Saccharomyces cerevisiae]|nr:unnamed protein product [Saccharomyces cerevisiae]
MVEDMVLVNHQSLLAWQKYFEWTDYEDLDNMDAPLIIKYFKKFPKDPLAMILYSWLSSKLSKYDIKSLESANKPPEGHKKTEKETDIKDVDETNEDEVKDRVEDEVKDRVEDEVKDQDEEAKEDEEEDLDDIEIGLLEEEVVTVLTENIVKL